MSSEGLTIAQAIEELSATEEQAPEQTQQQAQPEPVEQPAAEETEQPSDTTDASSEAEEPGDAETTEDEPEAAAITLDPPKWWSKDKKEAFKALPPELQAVVFEQEEVRERVVAKTKQETAEAKKAAADEAARFQQRIAFIDSVLPKVAQNLQSRWANVDWQRAAVELDPQEYNRYRAAYEQEINDYNHLQAENRAAQEQQLQKFDAEQEEALEKAWHDLPDAKLRKQRREEVTEFAKGLGATPQEIRMATATMHTVFYDAMRWRKAQAEMAARPKPKNPATPAATVRPTPPASRTPIDAKVREAQARYDRDPSVKNLESLMNLQERAS